MTRDRLTYTKWTRRAGGYKTCPACHRKHPEMMRINGRPQRPKACVEWGTALPSRLSYPKKGRVLWFIREFDPVSGQSKDHPCRSSEDADEFIRRKERDSTRDPTQERLIEHASVLSRQIEADGFDEAVNTLIVKLGGDPVSRTLKPIGLQDAIDQICDEMRFKEKVSAVYIGETRRTAGDFIAIVGLKAWSDAGKEAVKKFALALSAGNWTREDRRVKPLGGHAVKRSLATLRAFFVRAAQNGWVHPRIIRDEDETERSVWSQAVEGVEHPYMPDEHFVTLIRAADDDRWMRTLILVAYNTAARRGDLLRLRWVDVNLDGAREESSKLCATIRIANHKGNAHRKVKKPIYVPLDQHVLDALKDLRANPVAVLHPHTPPNDRVVRVDEHGRAIDDEAVFPICGYQHPGPELSRMFGEFCVRAGLADGDGANKWGLHDIRRKANEDILRAGGSLREAMSLTGHSSAQVNVTHYQSSADIERLRVLTQGMSGFRGLRLVRESA